MSDKVNSAPLATSRPHGPPQRPIVKDDKSDVVFACTPGMPLAICFTSFRHQMGIPLEDFDGYLAAMGMSAIYLRDRRRRFYLSGIESIGQRRQLAKAIRGWVDQYQAPRLACIGVSAGGFGAIAYGVEANADVVATFGAPTCLSLDRAPQTLIEADTRLQARVATMRTMKNHDRLDVRAIVAGRASPPPLHLFYSAGFEADAKQTEYVADLPNVILHPENRKRHGLVQPLANAGKLAKRLRVLAPEV